MGLLGKVINGIWGVPQAQIDAEDAAIRANQQDAIARGIWNEEQIAGVDERYWNMVGQGANIEGQIEDEFIKGLEEGRDKIHKTIWEIIKQILLSIPGIVWIGLVVFIFIWMGGLALLRGRLAR